MADVIAFTKHSDRCEAHILGGVHKRGISVLAIMNKDSPVQSILESYGVPIKILYPRSFYDRRAIKELRRLLISESAKILHCFTNRTLSNGIFAAKGLRVKCVAYRGTSGHVGWFSPYSWLTYLNPKVDKIVCVSDAVRDFLSRFVNKDKLIRIYKGHDPKWYETNINFDPKELGIPEGAFLVSCIANVRPVKGIQYLLDAFKYLPKELEIHALIVGHHNETLKNQIEKEKLSRVHLLGFQTKVASVLKSSNAFIMPSIAREGLPKALLEAMCLGITPIVTSVGGMIEVIRNEENGLIVPPKDSKAIAAALMRLYQDREESKQMAEAARLTVENKFNIRSSVEQYEMLYKNLLGI